MSDPLISEQDVESFFEDGYLLLRSVVPSSLREMLERSIVQSYAMQALKFLALREKLGGRPPEDFRTVEDLDEIVGLLEEHDREAAYQALWLIEASPGGRAFTAWDELAQISARLLRCPQELTLMTPPAPFINQPNSKRLLYRWHSEAGAYPKRRNFLNIWLPLFRDKHSKNGTMILARRSHVLDDVPFVDYRGYDRETLGTANYLVQYETPESFFLECERVPVEAAVGDLVVFHRKTIHTSAPNTSPFTTYVGVMRAWDPRGDLTISGDIQAKPYGGDLGRPGIDAIPSS
jgi:hypothetical protein